MKLDSCSWCIGSITSRCSENEPTHLGGGGGGGGGRSDTREQRKSSLPGVLTFSSRLVCLLVEFWTVLPCLFDTLTNTIA